MTQSEELEADGRVWFSTVQGKELYANKGTVSARRRQQEVYLPLYVNPLVFKREDSDGGCLE